MNRMFRLFATALATAVAIGAQQPAYASLTTLTDLFVFGDSLSDGGNSGLRSKEVTGGTVVFPPFPYFNGQYSNGPVAVEYLWNSYNGVNPGRFTPSLAGGTNYAIGGSTTGVENYNSLSAPAPLRPAYEDYGAAWQLSTFAAQNPAFDPATSLFVVWLFPNDVFYFSQTGVPPGTVPGSPGSANVVENGIANIVTTVSTLAQAGAQHFLVPNMPNLAKTPAFRGTPVESDMNAVSIAFNTNLAIALTALDQLLPAEIVQFDTAGLFDEVLGNPGAFGFTNTTDQCVQNLASGLCNPGNWNDWLFWDGVHPTTAGHSFLGAEFRRAVPEPSSLVLVIPALFAVAARRRMPRT